MIQLSEKDYRPLKTFPLAWRWTEPRRSLVPDEVVANIRPLSFAKATEIYSMLEQRSHQEDEGFMPASFRLVNKIDTSDIDMGPVRNWLEAHISDLKQAVIVYWETALAAATTGDIFCRFWDDFCYPSSDDVTILPLSEEWALVYWHEEILFFGERITL
jgi:hypothetical protein